MKILESLEAYKTASESLAELQSQIKELQEKAKKIVEAQNEAQAQIDNEMQNLGEVKMQHLNFSVSYRKSKETVITDEALLDDMFFKYTKSVIKADVKKAIEAGQLIAGAEIVEKQNIQIKF